jgi:hypothetical protein
MIYLCYTLDNKFYFLFYIVFISVWFELVIEQAFETKF